MHTKRFCRKISKEIDYLTDLGVTGRLTVF